jgi:adenylosuccinate synthase
MLKRLVIVSGPIASGKSMLARHLADKHGAKCFRTKDWILQRRPKTPSLRLPLQEAGEALDVSTKGGWVVDSLARELQTGTGLPPSAVVVLDSVRIPEQVDALRRAYGGLVVHIHVTASDDELRRRYKRRSAARGDEPDYEVVKRNATEKQIESLAQVADVVINSDRCTPEDIFIRATTFLDLHPRSIDQLVDVLIGGQYGSEGKGNIVSYIAPEYDYLVRVGGPNAGHKVYEEPEPYTFHLLPSGTRTSTAKLIVGPGAVLNVEQLLQEIRECQVEADRLVIDENAMTIDEHDRKQEQTMRRKIASTAQGVGAATSRKIMGRFPGSDVRLARDVVELRPYIGDALETYERAFQQGKRILLEGTQGTSLSIHHGSYPWVTSRDTTAGGCLSEAGIPPRRVRRIVMVCRTYPIRVGDAKEGTSGPMSRPILLKEIAARSGIPLKELRKTEITSTTNRPRKIAEFDWAQLRRNVALNSPTDIALTFVDYLDIKNRTAFRFEQLQPGTLRFIEEIERVAGVPVNLISVRFHSRSVIDRRTTW